MHQPAIVEIRTDCLDDGPGIRTVIFSKGCPLRCAWCHNPECLDPQPQLLFRQTWCIGCGECHTSCPEGVIDQGGPRASSMTGCRACGSCARGCPSGALELKGRTYSIDELLSIVLRHERVFRNSGGGVTLSGGEPGLYCAYFGAFAHELRRRGVSVLLETAGQFSWDTFSTQLLPACSIIYFDLKLLERDAHEAWCGRPNDQILANLARLASLPDAPELLVRLPLIPGATTGRDNLRRIGTWLRDHGIRRLALLPYNPLFRHKATMVVPRAGQVGALTPCCPPVPLSESTLSPAELERIKGFFVDFDLVVPGD